MLSLSYIFSVRVLGEVLVVVVVVDVVVQLFIVYYFCVCVLLLFVRWEAKTGDTTCAFYEAYCTLLKWAANAKL